MAACIFGAYIITSGQVDPKSERPKFTQKRPGRLYRHN